MGFKKQSEKKTPAQIVVDLHTQRKTRVRVNVVFITDVPVHVVNI